MRVSLRWLRDFVDLPLEDPIEIGDLLAGLGHEVEGIEMLDVPFTGVEVARVESIRPHPDADKIRLVTVDRGGSDPGGGVRCLELRCRGSRDAGHGWSRASGGLRDRRP